MINYDQLSEKELLGILIGEKKGEHVSESLIKEFSSLPELLAGSAEEELMKIKGIGMMRTKQIKACYELAMRLQATRATTKKIIKQPQDVANLVMHEMRYLKKEYFRIILLNTKCQLISIEDVSVGSLNSSIVHPREVFTLPVKKSAAGILAVHNHPSGDPTPSNEDIAITKRLKQAGEIIGIPLHDHIVIGDGTYISLTEKNMI